LDCRLLLVLLELALPPLADASPPREEAWAPGPTATAGPPLPPLATPPLPPTAVAGWITAAVFC
jgi:hypothetical protein